MTTVEAEPIIYTASSVEEVRLILQREMIDKAVRAARNGGWCEQFERSMRLIFPDGPPVGEGSRWVDFDGIDCRGYDRDGYLNGYDPNGFDKEGYSRQGMHRDTGLDRLGFDRYGYDTDGYDRDGFNREGISRPDADGVRKDLAGNLVGSSEHEDWLYRFDASGYDADGFGRQGTHRDSGLTRAEHARRFRFNANYEERPVTPAS